MKAGQIVLRWNERGELDIKTSLTMDAANKELALGVLLDAARAVHEAAAVPLLNAGVHARILAGN